MLRCPLYRKLFSMRHNPIQSATSHDIHDGFFAHFPLANDHPNSLFLFHREQHAVQLVSYLIQIVVQHLVPRIRRTRGFITGFSLIAILQHVIVVVHANRKHVFLCIVPDNTHKGNGIMVQTVLLIAESIAFRWNIRSLCLFDGRRIRMDGGSFSIVVPSLDVNVVGIDSEKRGIARHIFVRRKGIAVEREFVVELVANIVGLQSTRFSIQTSVKLGWWSWFFTPLYTLRSWSRSNTIFTLER